MAHTDCHQIGTEAGFWQAYVDLGLNPDDAWPSFSTDWGTCASTRPRGGAEFRQKFIQAACEYNVQASPQRPYSPIMCLVRLGRRLVGPALYHATIGCCPDCTATPKRRVKGHAELYARAACSIPGPYFISEERMYSNPLQLLDKDIDYLAEENPPQLSAMRIMPLSTLEDPEGHKVFDKIAQAGTKFNCKPMIAWLLTLPEHITSIRRQLCIHESPSTLTGLQRGVCCDPNILRTMLREGLVKGRQGWSLMCDAAIKARSAVAVRELLTADAFRHVP